MEDSCQVPKEAWGPALWSALHAMSFAYPLHANAAQKRGALEWLGSVGPLLPCPSCASNWHVETAELSNASDRERILRGRDSLSRYLVEVHNRVNRRIGKPPRGYESVRYDYCPGHGSLRRGGPWRFRAVAVAGILAGVLVWMLLQPTPGRSSTVRLGSTAPVV